MYFFVLNCDHHSAYIFKEGLTLLVNEFASNKAKKERERDPQRTSRYNTFMFVVPTGIFLISTTNEQSNVTI
jgi:hypothetical protein